MNLDNPFELICETARTLNFIGIDHDGYNFTSIKPNVLVHVKPLKPGPNSQNLDYIIQLQVGNFINGLIGPSKVVPNSYNDALIEARKVADDVEKILNDPTQIKTHPWTVILDLLNSPQSYEMQPKHPFKPLFNPYSFISQNQDPYPTSDSMSMTL